jgi:hypothetical protein
MMQRRKSLSRRSWSFLALGCLVGLALMSVQHSSGGNPAGDQAAAAMESGTDMQAQHPTPLPQRPAIDLAFPQVTETALFALG